MISKRTIPIVADVAGDDCSGAESFALMVLGDSMAPEFAAGDIVVVEPGGLAHNGSFVIARIGGEWTFRQLVATDGAWSLRALNLAYPSQSISDLALIRGVVIQKSRPGCRRAAKRYVE
jgi:DNA polymerase V